MHRALTVSTGILFVAALLITLSTLASAGDLPPSLHDEVTILPSIPGTAPESATPSLRVLKNDDREVELEFELPGLLHSQLDAEGQTFDLVAIENGSFDGEEGAPMLPTFSRFIAIPDRKGVEIEVTGIEKSELTGFRLAPMQPGEPGPFKYDASAYLGAGFPSVDPVTIGEPAVMRDLRVVRLKFNPVRYDAAGSRLEIASRVQVKVRFDGEDTRNVKESHATVVASSFDQLYRSLVVNYEGPRDGQTLGNGTYVIITPNNSTVIGYLDYLVSWRRNKGFPVYVATTAETGTTTTSIQNWLRNAYNTWDNPPEYIVLVGDADSGSSVRIPPFYYNGGETDFPYTQLDGTDIFPEAHVGRITAYSADDVNEYVHKIVDYESSPYMDDTSWYTRGCVVGDPSSSGYTCVQVAQWTDMRMRANGCTEVSAIYSSPFVSQMVTQLSRGDTYFMYRGYWGMSGFDTGDVNAVANGRKMNFSCQITCGSGDYDNGTSISEAWVLAGTLASPRGGIGAVATSTLSTHTRYNNCLSYGMGAALYNDHIYTMGAATNRARFQLYLDYYGGDSGQAWNFTHWANLMGDPAGEVWTGVPQAIVVTHPASLALGANAITVSVTKAGAPLAGATVCAYKDGQTHVAGWTAEDGTIQLPLDVTTAGNLTLTVTKHNCMPYSAAIPVSQQARFVGFNAFTIDDDSSGGSSGNGDGTANPGERIELPIQLKNFGSQAVTTISGTLTSDDPFVTVTDAAESFPNLAAGATGWSVEDFDIILDGGAPNGYLAQCNLDVTSGADTWRSLVEIPVVAADFAVEATTVYDVGTRFDPGETGTLSVRIRNNGAASGASVTGRLISQGPWITISDATGSFGNIGIGATGENTSDRFGISVAAAAFNGHVAPFRVALQFSSGARDTVDFGLPIGQRVSTDPTGPDRYGYYAFDNTDVSYPDAPVYSWVEIDPRYGGSGTSVGLTDTGEGLDDTNPLSLPFMFKYYGKQFNSIAVCSNGWIAMGGSSMTNENNWCIPAAGAPSNMIAPGWCAMRQSGSNMAYYWSDTANHRFIIQWSRMINDGTGGTMNFEVILYDPAYHPTATGDGIIVFQYDAFSVGTANHNYFTTGIQNGECNDGVSYAYFNIYSGGSATITNGRAIKFMPVQVIPVGTLSGRVRNYNGNFGVAGAEVTVLGRTSFTTEGDGSYAGSLEVGLYTVVASHPSFLADTALAVPILQDQVTTLNFTLHDIQPPALAHDPLPSTTDNVGPYAVTATITDSSVLEEVTLTYNAAGAGWVTVPLISLGSDEFSASIPGQPYGSMIRYYLHARDAGDLSTYQPAGAPEEVNVFWVIPPVFTDDMEAGAGTWTNYIVSSGFRDQWHRSSTRNHTANGSWSWKFGDTASGTYVNLSDGALETEAFNLTGAEATLSFWHWMQAEVSATYPGYAYDGGIIEMSVDGQPWTQVTPETGGYNYTVRAGAQPGPFPEGILFFSGTYDWMQSAVDLTGINGSVRFRFRFGSDGSVGQEGWYVDDVELIALDPSASDAEEPVAVPVRLALHQNAPNPFGTASPRTTIAFDLPQPMPVRLTVLDVNGRLVRTLADETMPAGFHRVNWMGDDAKGHRVDSGVYFYVLKTGAEEIARQMLILR